jgi:hypothetical protein
MPLDEVSHERPKRFEESKVHGLRNRRPKSKGEDCCIQGDSEGHVRARRGGLTGSYRDFECSEICTQVLLYVSRHQWHSAWGISDCTGRLAC